MKYALVKLSALSPLPAFQINRFDIVAGFPVLFMYFSRRLVPAFKSRDFFECACNGERRQTL